MTRAPLRIVWSWPDLDPASLDPGTAIVSRVPAGRWRAVPHVDVAHPIPVPTTGSKVGIDLALMDFAVLSTGEPARTPTCSPRRRSVVPAPSRR